MGCGFAVGDFLFLGGVAGREIDLAAKDGFDPCLSACLVEVDGSEDEHLRGRRVAQDEDLEALAEPLALGSVVEKTGGARSEHPDGVLADRVVEPGGPERTLSPIGAHHEMTADGVRALDNGRDRDGLLRRDARSDPLELRPGRLVDPLDEHLEDSAAREPDRERIVITHAIRLEPANAVSENVLAHLKECSLDASAAHRSDSLAGVGHEH